MRKRRVYKSKNKGEHFGVFFDDIVDDATAGDWSQVCSSCVRRQGLPKEALDDYTIDNTTICGVKGCKDMASYFITFYRGYNYDD